MRLTDGIVVVRTPTDDDAPAIVDAISSSHRELSQWLPFAQAGYSINEALSWIRGETDPGHPGVIVDPEGRIVGTAGLNLVNEINQMANLGYWLRTDATGHGWAGRATALVARYGIETVGLHRIEIIMSVENEPSRRVAERAGATYEGVLRGRLLLDGRHHDAHSFSVVPGDLT